MLKRECVIFFEKQVSVLFGSGSPAIRFIPMEKSGCPLLSGLGYEVGATD
ncbi:hypothetical protein [Pedobacter terrae]|nr:hypothetical protein [Pedobacter terrae]